MNDLQDEGTVESVADDTANEAVSEDRIYDNLNDAAQALADDDEGEAPKEQPTPAEPDDADPAEDETPDADPDDEDVSRADALQ